MAARALRLDWALLLVRPVLLLLQLELLVVGLLLRIMIMMLVEMLLAVVEPHRVLKERSGGSAV